jgi:dGTPase
MYKMNWQQLIDPTRLGKSASPDDSERTPFQRDYDRILFSSPFRRLKNKTQIFSLPNNDYVRTRLIHTLEVASVGRSLGRAIGDEVVKRNKLTCSEADIGDIVSAACLAHDIGNPPFGHTGESAIGLSFDNWDRNLAPEKTKILETLTNSQKTDFRQFEGNAQGFRIVTKLEMKRDRGGMQLTYPTLAAFTKYPRESLISSDILNGYTGKSAKKFGFFQAEKDLFKEVAETLGLIRRDDRCYWWARHPLSFLVEAADDICYSIVDIEDSYRMKCMSFEKAAQFLNAIAQVPASDFSNESENEQIKYLRAKAIGVLIKDTVNVFREYEDEILAGKFDDSLISRGKYHQIIDNEIMVYMAVNIYCHPTVLGIQVAGFEVLDKLFLCFLNASIDSKSAKNRTIVNMLPEEFRSTDRDSLYTKILKITDYLSGMTDSYATSIFQTISGISIYQ